MLFANQPPTDAAFGGRRFKTVQRERTCRHRAEYRIKFLHGDRVVKVENACSSCVGKVVATWRGDGTPVVEEAR